MRSSRKGKAGQQHATREAVHRLLDLGLPRIRIAEELGIAKSTVSYHARRLGAPVDHRFRHRYDWSAIRTAYEDGLTMTECRERFGFSKGAWFTAIQRGDIAPRSAGTPLHELLTAGRKRGRHNMKRRLVEAGLKLDRCEECQIVTWNDESITMSLHHVNGDALDNRLENIRFLCPNCHSQTPNFGRRNGHRRPARSP